MVLPSGDQLLQVIAGLDRPGRLTLVEGAGGLLVELAAAGVTLLDPDALALRGASSDGRAFVVSHTLQTLPPGAIENGPGDLVLVTSGAPPRSTIRESDDARSSTWEPGSNTSMRPGSARSDWSSP